MRQLKITFGFNSEVIVCNQCCFTATVASIQARVTDAQVFHEQIILFHDNSHTIPENLCEFTPPLDRTV